MKSGFAALVIVLVIGMTALLVTLSLTQTTYIESLMGRRVNDAAAAFYAAESGVEEVFAALRSNPNFGNPGPDNISLSVGAGISDVVVTGDIDTRTILASGSIKQTIKRLRVVVQNTSLKPGFLHAIHAGAGGFEMRNNTLITGLGGLPGNVFSNASIKGAKNDHDSHGVCRNASSHISGSVWAVETVTQLSPSDSGICVDENIHAASLEYCYANGDIYSSTIPSATCTYAGSYVPEPTLTPYPLPDMGINLLKEHVKPNLFEGDCILDGSGNPADCTGGTNQLGNLSISGNLIKNSNVSVTINGPVWVKGDAIFNSQGAIDIDPSITSISQLMIVDGTITSDSNISFGSNGTAFLLFISTYKPSTAPDTSTFCDIPAITISSNSQSVLFYAPDGCIEITANSTFHGAVLGQKILLDNNSTIEYNPNLATAIFGLTDSGGWQTVSFTEE